MGTLTLGPPVEGVWDLEYELLDFGEGRRLERFGPWTLDRPCPAAAAAPRANAALWERADARFERSGPGEGRWVGRQAPQRWIVGRGPIRLELKLAQSGHVGCFPEQTPLWQWMHRAAAAAGPIRALNLFAYTGGSTLALAHAGAETTHLDAAGNVVAWAQRNAELSGLADARIAWIAHDVRKFVRSALRSEASYDAVVLDPPSYGRGAHGEVWRLVQHLPGLLAACARLTAGRRRFLLVTCHTPGYGADRLAALASEALAEGPPGSVTAEPMLLHDAAGRPLPSGAAAYWVAADLPKVGQSRLL